MGVELEIHTAPPARWNYEKSRGTLVRRSYEHGEALSELLLGLDKSWRNKALWDVDPYGNTLFGEQRAQVALGEVSDLLRRCAGPAQEAAVLNLERMLVYCASTPGTHLWFIGD
ncbi:hypothetical protein ACGFRB_00970 [Streptomyces sp. NPDC048718]|uniref:hypothetical protein n=1 Tax=Streptomyces sp. NPDC048718 TaxID=3365587 RepID=UPI003716A020